jgi:hypothetical protein
MNPELPVPVPPIVPTWTTQDDALLRQIKTRIEGMKSSAVPPPYEVFLPKSMEQRLRTQYRDGQDDLGTVGEAVKRIAGVVKVSLWDRSGIEVARYEVLAAEDVQVLTHVPYNTLSPEERVEIDRLPTVDGKYVRNMTHEEFLRVSASPPPVRPAGNPASEPGTNN